jgi:hypothetical protein
MGTGLLANATEVLLEFKQALLNDLLVGVILGRPDRRV